MNFKKSCVLCRNCISIYKINRTLHGRSGIQILSSRAESISPSFASLTRERYFQHSKIKFVSPHSHVISSILPDLVEDVLAVGFGILVFLIHVGVSLAAYMKSFSSTAHSG